MEDMTAGFGASGDYVVGKRTATVLISYEDALEAVRQGDITRFQPRIQTSVRRRGFAAIKYILCGPPPLHEDLVADRDLAFCMAACPFSNDDILHHQVLQTIYRKLTGSRFDCPRYGTHWEQVGFQGTDPATDLRGVGFLALLHLLYALTTPRTAHLIHDIYKLSHDEVQNFPLCIMSINMTRIAVQGLREGCLNKWCNHGNQVVAVLNDFYMGTFLRMYHIWKHERKTIRDSGFVLQDVEKYVKKHPAMVLRTLEAHAHAPERRRSPSPPNVTMSPLHPEELDEYINERYPSTDDLDDMPAEDISSKNFFTVCKDDGDDNLGNLI
ncbi:hypothetical protein NP493_17g09005 [Ridgeia piscesae]|uniref:ELMO domain-containing protein n=1 Tax=Ridgeia piscesae TaxID=27915 RepID=A0AAD9PEB5_RIDPI|nr:hypothetical protein NP493_17g09005 [Ridgeia piscesae]